MTARSRAASERLLFSLLPGTVVAAMRAAAAAVRAANPLAAGEKRALVPQPPPGAPTSPGKGGTPRRRLRQAGKEQSSKEQAASPEKPPPVDRAPEATVVHIGRRDSGAAANAPDRPRNSEDASDSTSVHDIDVRDASSPRGAADGVPDREQGSPRGSPHGSAISAMGLTSVGHVSALRRSSSSVGRSSSAGRTSSVGRSSSVGRLSVGGGRCSDVSMSPHARKSMLAALPVQPVLTWQFETALFLQSDIVGFTSLGSRLSPYELVQLLHSLFSSFDTLAHELRVYKVETIGDAFQAGVNCVPGEVSPDLGEAADRLMRLADGMIKICAATTAPDGSPVNIRIGLHAGPSTGAVVGGNCPRYHHFGLALDGAEILEQASAPGRVRVSGAFVEACGGPAEILARGRMLQVADEVAVDGLERPPQPTFFLSGREI